MEKQIINSKKTKTSNSFVKSLVLNEIDHSTVSVVAIVNVQ